MLRALLAACGLVEELAPAVHRASLQLLAQLAHSFFMPLCLTALAALARIQVRPGSGRTASLASPAWERSRQHLPVWPAQPLPCCRR